MCCDDTTGIRGYQFSDKTDCSIMFVIAIGTAENFIQYHKSLFTGLQLMNDGLQTFQLGIKERFTILQSIGNTHTDMYRIWIKNELVCTHIAASSCQYQVDAKSSQKSAFAGHIRAGKDDKSLLRK